MKIAQINVSIVSVPFHEPEAWRFGRAWGVSNAIVEVQTDEGLAGVGEAPGNPAVEVIAAAIRAMTPMLVGEDPLEIARLRRRIRHRGWHHYPHIGNTAWGALEIALWDLAGQATGRPISALFGGTVRDAVPFYWYLSVPDREPSQAVEQALEGLEKGHRTIYIKVGFDLQQDLAISRAVREAIGGGIELRVDANEGWTHHEAIRALRALEELELEFCEQPIDMNDIEGLARLRARTGTPIAANQTAWLENNLLEIIRSAAADVIVSDPHQAGGLISFRNVAGICEIAQLPLVKHSFGDLGITTAATLHLLACLHDPPLAHQTHLPLLEHDLLTRRFEFQDGALAIPTEPGLGIELDRDALAHYSTLYQRLGEFSGYAPPEAPRPTLSEAS